MWLKNKGYDFSDTQTSFDYFYSTSSEVIKEYFIDRTKAYRYKVLVQEWI